MSTNHDDRLKVAAHTEEQIQVFCQSHNLPRRNVARIRKPEDLYYWKSRRLLLLPSWWLGTNSDTVSSAKDRGWEIAEVTEDEVLNGTTPPASAPMTVCLTCPHPKICMKCGECNYPQTPTLSHSDQESNLRQVEEFSVVWFDQSQKWIVLLSDGTVIDRNFGAVGYATNAAYEMIGRGEAEFDCACDTGDFYRFVKCEEHWAAL